MVLRRRRNNPFRRRGRHPLLLGLRLLHLVQHLQLHSFQVHQRLGGTGRRSARQLRLERGLLGQRGAELGLGSAHGVLQEPHPGGRLPQETHNLPCPFRVGRIPICCGLGGGCLQDLVLLQRGRRWRCLLLCIAGKARELLRLCRGAPRPPRGGLAAGGLLELLQLGAQGPLDQVHLRGVALGDALLARLQGAQDPAALLVQVVAHEQGVQRLPRAPQPQQGPRDLHDAQPAAAADVQDLEEVVGLDAQGDAVHLQDLLEEGVCEEAVELRLVQEAVVVLVLSSDHVADRLDEGPCLHDHQLAAPVLDPPALQDAVHDQPRDEVDEGQVRDEDVPDEVGRPEVALLHGPSAEVGPRLQGHDLEVGVHAAPDRAERALQLLVVGGAQLAGAEESAYVYHHEEHEEHPQNGPERLCQAQHQQRQLPRDTKEPDDAHEPQELQNSEHAQGLQGLLPLAANHLGEPHQRVDDPEVDHRYQDHGRVEDAVQVPAEELPKAICAYSEQELGHEDQSKGALHPVEDGRHDGLVAEAQLGLHLQADDQRVHRDDAAEEEVRLLRSDPRRSLGLDRAEGRVP
mmetsp:Transcript_39284/g.117433  ORF Transcript_39284/g.117433 Transcript_39284/m.117433 type:complete len:573 (+) Transcript_39284:279-1997(+)